MQDLPMTPGNRRIAMLIDADNAQPSSTLIEKMIAEASKYGLVTIRRAYGDWTMPQMKSWREIASIHAIQPIQQFQNTVGKNATDSALIIDAMDILYDGNVSGFCLVSSDSDYTRLTTRLREKGLFVMGIGQNTTPRAFVNACEVFVYTQNLIAEKEKPKIAPPSPEKSAVEVVADPLPLLKNAFDMAVQEDGWAFLGTIGGYLRQLDPSFDTRTYGYRQLSQLIRAHSGVFEIREQKSRSGPTLIYVKLREDRR
ncbi:MAG: NYN domain-containing protein [Chloroflexi bacterium]|nr:NYN domain-containing protein [Chloroflexota bacterium]